MINRTATRTHTQGARINVYKRLSNKKTSNLKFTQMEKPATKPKSNNILRFLPKAGAISFQSSPFSPAHDNRPHMKLRKRFQRAFSGPITYMIPAEARRKSKNFETTQEPTSPKISCMGQIKPNNKILTQKQKESKPVSSPRAKKSSKNRPESPVHELKKKQSGFKSIFGGRRKFDAPIDRAAKPPSLNHMRRFASTRDTFANFDWTTAHEEEDDVIIPFSEPILDSGAGLGLEPRKEINLWKRRTMVQPKPLHLNLVGEP